TWEFRQIHVHAEDRVGNNQSAPCGRGGPQERFQMVQVPVLKDPNSGLAQTASIDDGSMVQFVAVDLVLFPSQRGTKANVGHIARGRDQSRVFFLKGSQVFFQLLVQVKMAADKARAGG